VNFSKFRHACLPAGSPWSVVFVVTFFGAYARGKRPPFYSSSETMALFLLKVDLFIRFDEKD
jgi:hypothetical protein